MNHNGPPQATQQTALARARATALAVGTIALAALATVVTLAPPAPDSDRPAVSEPRPASTPAADPAGADQRWNPLRPTRTARPVDLSSTRWVPADTAALHPGVRTETAGGGRCTSNFVFTVGARTFLGQAAHCAGTGIATETNGCAAGTRPLGTAVTVRAADGSNRTATLAYSSWITMQQRAEPDPDACAYNDFALVELTATDAAQVNPSLPVLGGPTGLDTGGLPVGEPVFGLSGPPPGSGGRPGDGGIGEGGADGSGAGESGAGGRVGPRSGVSVGDVGRGFGHRISIASPGVPGESGSAFVDGAGAAVGVLTTLNLSAHPVNNGITDLAAALDYANTHGGLGEIELALGTRDFVGAPLGSLDLP